MFDIESKVNKYDQKAFIFNANKYETYRSFGMVIPKYNIDIDLWSENHEIIQMDYNNEYWEHVKFSISVGKKEFCIEYGPISEDVNYVYKKLKNFDYKTIVRLTIAYAWGKENLKNTFLQGKTKKDLKKLSFEELEKLNNTINNFDKRFKDAFDKVLYKCNVEDAQEILNEFFGEKAVNVDELVEDAVDDALRHREIVTERKSWKKAMDVQQKKLKLEKENLKEERIARIKAGAIKTLEPAKMMAKKLKDLANKIKLSVKNMKIAKERKKQKENLIDNLDELSKQ